MSYSYVEKMDKLWCYIQCNNNVTAAVKLYTELYDDNHTIPSHLLLQGYK